jgi:ATP-binding cassette subfamily B protein
MSTPPIAPPIAPHSVWQLAWQVSQHRAREFWLGLTLWTLFFATPAFSGYFLSRGYDTLSTGDVEGTVRWASLVAIAEVVRMAAVHSGAIVWTQVWVHMQTLLRANLLIAQMASGGPEAGQPVGSAGSAITHFRDDAEDVANFVDIMLDVTGGLVFTVIAGFVLGAADPAAAAIVVVPMAAVVLVTRILDPKLKAYRRADRAATEQVTGLLGDVMAAATTVKVNDATGSTLARLRTLVDRRRHTAVRDRVLEESVYAFSEGAASVGLGLVLIVSSSALASGAFDVGRLALFVAYLGWMTFLPRMVGRLMARTKQVSVAFDRMSELVADTDPSNTVRSRDLPIGVRDDRVRPVTVRPDRIELERLSVDGLSIVHGDGTGVREVSFEVERGDFVVITGPVGAGKSTLLRGLLGLAWQAESTGEVRWNGFEVQDRAAFFVPPNAAFLSQVPQLISDSVGDNVSLGPVADGAVARALEIAAITPDVAAMPGGVDTMIGPRGLRLSGGQRQRLALARALVHQPELLILDDLSSAVDVETEVELWENLRQRGVTVIAVSHRTVAFERSTSLYRLDRGRLTRA